MVPRRLGCRGEHLHHRICQIATCVMSPAPWPCLGHVVSVQSCSVLLPASGCLGMAIDTHGHMGTLLAVHMDAAVTETLLWLWLAAAGAPGTATVRSGYPTAVQPHVVVCTSTFEA